MAKGKKAGKAPVYFREWRKHRDLTQAKAADRAGLAQSTITKLENGRIVYDQGHLESLAHAYACEVRDLFRPPGHHDNELAAYVMRMEAADRAKALKVLKAINTKEPGESEEVA